MAFHGHQANTEEVALKKYDAQKTQGEILIISSRKNKEMSGNRGKLRKNHVKQ